MPLQKRHLIFLALSAGSICALSSAASPDRQVAIDVYMQGSDIVGEAVVSDPCRYRPHTPKPMSWGTFVGSRVRATHPCPAPSLDF